VDELSVTIGDRSSTSRWQVWTSSEMTTRGSPRRVWCSLEEGEPERRRVPLRLPSSGVQVLGAHLERHFLAARQQGGQCCGSLAESVRWVHSRW